MSADPALAGKRAEPPSRRTSALFEWVTRGAFAVAGAFLMLLAAALIGYAFVEVVNSLINQRDRVGPTLLQAVGYTVIAIAVFDVGKYILEEEAIRAREMREASEARRSLTKFISTIAIAVFLEALVAVFEAGKDDVRLMLYPTLLLLAGVALIVGLGVYQRLSASVEQDVDDEEDDPGGEGRPKRPQKRSAPDAA